MHEIKYRRKDLFVKKILLRTSLQGHLSISLLSFSEVKCAFEFRLACLKSNHYYSELQDLAVVIFTNVVIIIQWFKSVRYLYSYIKYPVANV